MDVRYLPHAGLGLSEICRWWLDGATEIGHEEPVEAVRRLAQRARSRGSALQLVIDDANAMPLETARTLGDLVRSLEGGLRLALASLDDARASRMLAGLDLDAVLH